MRLVKLFGVALCLFSVTCLAQTDQSNSTNDSHHGHHGNKEPCLYLTDCSGFPYARCTSGVCLHKNIMPFLAEEIAGIIILPILLGVSNIGGIGGGGLIIPISIALFGFSTREAIAISNATIFAGALVRFFFFSIWERHPHKDKTIIDYSVARIMMPVVLVGSYFGAIMNLFVPEVLVTSVMTLLLIYLTYNTFMKAKKMYKKETESKYYVEIPAEQPPHNLFEFKTLSNPPSSESQTETSNSCSNKENVVKPNEIQSPKLNGLF